MESSGDPSVRQQEYRPDLGLVSNYPSLLWHRYPGRQRRQLPRVHQMHLSKSQNHEQANLACDDERILARRRHTATSKSSTNKQTKKEVPTCLSVGHASKLKIIKIYPDLLVLIHVRRLEFIYVFVPVLTRDQLRPTTLQTTLVLWDFSPDHSVLWDFSPDHSELRPRRSHLEQLH